MLEGHVLTRAEGVGLAVDARAEEGGEAGLTGLDIALLFRLELGKREAAIDADGDGSVG